MFSLLVLQVAVKQIAPRPTRADSSKLPSNWQIPISYRDVGATLVVARGRACPCPYEMLAIGLNELALDSRGDARRSCGQKGIRLLELAALWTRHYTVGSKSYSRALQRI